MLTLRQRIFLISGIVVSIILVIMFIILWQRRQANPTENITDTTDTTQVDTGTTNTREVPIESITGRAPQNINPDELLAKQVSRIFVERFMTYSNQNDNRHIGDALVLATGSMASWIQAQSLETGDIYEGVTTRVLSSSVRDLTPTSATVEIAVQQEMRTATSSELMQKNGRVELVKAENTWLVNGFYWE